MLYNLLRRKIDLSSSMYNKEQDEDLRYDFSKSVKSIKEWKCHILHSQNEEKAKQSLVQDLREDSVFVVIDWAIKSLQHRF